jgi:hypothetical protein
MELERRLVGIRVEDCSRDTHESVALFKSKDGCYSLKVGFIAEVKRRISIQILRSRGKNAYLEECKLCRIREIRCLPTICFDFTLDVRLSESKHGHGDPNGSRPLMLTVRVQKSPSSLCFEFE